MPRESDANPAGRDPAVFHREVHCGDESDKPPVAGKRTQSKQSYRAWFPGADGVERPGRGDRASRSLLLWGASGGAKNQ